MTPRPTPLPVLVKNIPHSMRVERRWVVWHYVWKEDQQKWDKPPYIATAPDQHADSTDPATWRSCEEALASYQAGKCDGIGFVLGDGWTGFDSDGSAAPEYVAILNTYTEESPSGDGGVHCLCRGVKPGPRCTVGKRPTKYELYDHGRYFTVTGHHVGGTPTTVEERTPEIATLYSRLFPVEHESAKSSSVLADDALIAKASASKTGAKFAALWKGDTTDYESHSEADLALCAYLAFWTNRDAAQMDRLFRRSGLMRDKWNRVGAGAIATAIASTTKGYTGTATKPHIIIRKASDVPDEQLEKVFGGRLVRGSFGFVSGPGEAGKGMLLADMASRFTTGRPFPGEKAERQPTNVMLCVVEDSMGRVKSRLRAAGADLERVFFVEGPEVRRGGLVIPSPMMLDDDGGEMVHYAEELKARAVFLETIVEHFGDRAGKARLSTHVEAEVRRALSPFRAVCELARLYGLAAIHPRKSVAGNVEDSVSGSAAFRNVPRGMHHVYRDPEDADSVNPVRLFFTSKANYLSQRPATLRFSIQSWDEERRIPCGCGTPDCGHEGRVIWEPDVVDERTAEEIWQQIADANKPRRDVAVQEAEDFLTGLMQNGEIPLTPEEIFALGKKEGITPAAIRRGKEHLGLVSVKSKGFPATVVAWKDSEL